MGLIPLSVGDPEGPRLSLLPRLRTPIVESMLVLKCLTVRELHRRLVVDSDCECNRTDSY